MEIQNINWNYPTNIWFGLNRIKEIQKACDNLNIKNPLIVTDPGITKTDIINKINSSLNQKANIFSKVKYILARIKYLSLKILSKLKN